MKIWTKITIACGCLLALYGIVRGAGHICGRADGKPRREAMAFLTENMPAGDRDTLPGELLRENVKYALQAREEFPWTAALPDSVFLNEVLPYAVVDEPRENWRPRFYALFEPRVRGMKTIEEAIEAVNRDINKAVGVEYDVRRARTNQSPGESMAQGMASCTGLSIILVDALRSVGVPARFAGTPLWWDGRGNHSWVEVWIDGEWRFTEFYPDPAGPDNAWFLPDAGRSEVWATSFKPTGEAFPMVWSEGSTEVHGVDVGDRYRARCQAVTGAREASGEYVEVRVDANRVAVNVDVFAAGVQLAGGRTSGPRDDAQRFLTFQLPKNSEITLRWSDEKGIARERKVTLGGDPMTVEL